MSERITLGSQLEQPATSLAQMLKSQYKSREIRDVLAATELREREVVLLSMLFMSRFVTMVMSTSKEDLETEDEAEKQSIKERLAIQRRILSDDMTMEFVKEDSFLYAFALLRQSLKRKSRGEAMTIATSPRPLEPAKGLGLKDKLFSKLGVSGKYKTEYVERDKR